MLISGRLLNGRCLASRSFVHEEDCGALLTTLQPWVCRRRPARQGLGVKSPIFSRNELFRSTFFLVGGGYSKNQLMGGGGCILLGEVGWTPPLKCSRRLVGIDKLSCRRLCVDKLAVDEAASASCYVPLESCNLLQNFTLTIQHLLVFVLILLVPFFFKICAAESCEIMNIEM